MLYRVSYEYYEICTDFIAAGSVYFLKHTRLNIKVTFILEHDTKAQGGVEVYLYSFFNLGTRCGGWSTPRPGRFTPGKDSVLTVQEAGCASEPFRAGAENLDPHRDSTTGPSNSPRVAIPSVLCRLQYQATRCIYLPSCKLCVPPDLYQGNTSFIF